MSNRVVAIQSGWFSRPLRRNGASLQLCYYLNDGVYHTYSGVIFGHAIYHLKSFRKGPTQICSVFGPTCDALDTISLTEQFPDMEMGEFVYSENIHRGLSSGQQHVL